jgi:hypothetical protein
MALPPTLPTRPDAEFAKRFSRTYAYGFFLHGLNGPLESFTVQLRLNPQSITMREPFSTVITPTQGAGKVVESRGIVTRNCTLTGTTGYIAPEFASGSLAATLVRGPLGPQTLEERTSQATRSGFKAFYDLRYLFTRYGYERSQGRRGVTMHYFDIKADEYWRIEPQDFTMSRSKAFSYNYSIAFVCLEPTTVELPPGLVGSQSIDSVVSRLPAIASRFPGANELDHEGRHVKPLKAMTKHTALATYVQATGSKRLDGGSTLVRLREMNNTGTAFLIHTTGAIKRSLQNVLRQVGNFVGFFEDIRDTYQTVIETPLALATQLSFAIDGLFILVDKFSPRNITGSTLRAGVELTEFLQELKRHVVHQFALVQGDTDGRGIALAQTSTSFGTTRGRRGASDAYLREPASNVGTPDVNPLVGVSGLGLMADTSLLAASATKRVVVSTGDTIFSLAAKYLGDTTRFLELVIVNHLDAPYIVSDQKQRASNTLAWGDYIEIPVLPADGDGIGSEEPDAAAPTFTSLTTRASTPLDLFDESLTSPWRTDQWVGYSVTVMLGGLPETRIVIANTETSLRVNRMWSTPPPAGSTYELSLVYFNPRRQVLPNERAFGRDLLLKFTTDNGRVYADLLVNSANDLATVSGLENLEQALLLRMNTELGTHPFAPTFGNPAPLGKPWNESLQTVYTYFLRRAFLADSRVAEVRNVRLSLQGDRIDLSAEVQPITVKSFKTLNVSVG